MMKIAINIKKGRRKGGREIIILFLKRGTDRSISRKQQFWLVSLNGSWKGSWFGASQKLWSWSWCGVWHFFNSTSALLKLYVRTWLNLRGTWTAQDELPGLVSSFARPVFLFRKALLTPQWVPSIEAHFLDPACTVQQLYPLYSAPTYSPIRKLPSRLSSKYLLLLEFPGQELKPLAHGGSLGLWTSNTQTPDLSPTLA